MDIIISADTKIGIATKLVDAIKKRGHNIIMIGGAIGKESGENWACDSHNAAKLVGEGRAKQGIICCFTGTGASIAANKVEGVRAALCHDAFTAAGARKWNDANVLCLSLRLISETLMEEILDAWFATEAIDNSQKDNINYLCSI